MLLLFATALLCGDCHQAIVDRWKRSPMANSSGLVQAAGESAGTLRRFSLAVKKAGDTLQLHWPGGAVDLTHFIGSKRMGRSYAFQYQGNLFQVPAGYYADRRLWDLPPGYERDRHPDFKRPITAECLACHSSDTARPSGIGCQSCHGESDDHAKLVNPAKLPPRQRDSVCEQCHLAGAVRLPRVAAAYRPGGDLAESVEVLLAASRPGVMVNSHAEQLNASRCKQGAGDKLSCSTCHNPHAESTDYNAACLGCHAKPHKPAGCVDCHMPKSRAHDGGHTVFTSHAIGGTVPVRDLRSYFGRTPSNRDLGMAYVKLASQTNDTALLEKAWPLLREAAAGQPRDAELYATIASLLAAGGRKEQAVAYYQLSLQQEPRQPGTLRKLAELTGDAKYRSQADRLLPLPRF